MFITIMAYANRNYKVKVTFFRDVESTLLTSSIWNFYLLTTNEDSRLALQVGFELCMKKMIFLEHV